VEWAPIAISAGLQLAALLGLVKLRGKAPPKGDGLR